MPHPTLPAIIGRAALLFLTFPVHGQSAAVKLSDSMTAGSSVVSVLSSGETQRAVYIADHDTRFVAELYSVSATGGTPKRINAPLVNGGDVLDFQLTPDGRWVIYRADQDLDQQIELYRTSVEGGPVTKLNGSLTPGGDVFDYQLSPDGNCVVYRADQDTDQTQELYSVPAAGGFAEKLNGFLEVGQDVLGDYRITADGSRVLYRADQETTNAVELFSVPIQGGLAIKLNSPLPLGGDVLAFLPAPLSDASPDNSRVVYLADGHEDQVTDLYSVPCTGGTVIKLNRQLPVGGDVIRFDLQSCKQLEGSPSELRVIYLADQEENLRNELFSVPITGGDVVRLNGPLILGGDVLDFEVSPHGDQVVYRADQETESQFGLYSVPATGGANIPLHGSLPPGGDVLEYTISPRAGPDGLLVIYSADQDTDQVAELFSVPLTGGLPNKLNPELTAGGNVLSFQVSPHGKTVSYLADQDTNGVDELFLVPAIGGTFLKLNGSLGEGGDVRSFQFSPEGARVFFTADQEVQNTVELYTWVSTSPQTYAEFKALHGLTTAPWEDEDEDNIPNVFEFTNGGDPLVKEFGTELLGIDDDEGLIRLTFLLPCPPAGQDLVVDLVSASTLRPEDWHVISQRSGSGSWSGKAPAMISPLGNGLQQILIEVPAAESAQRLFRLVLTVSDSDCQ